MAPAIPIITALAAVVGTGATIASQQDASRRAHNQANQQAQQQSQLLAQQQAQIGSSTVGGANANPTATDASTAQQQAGALSLISTGPEGVTANPTTGRSQLLGG